MDTTKAKAKQVQFLKRVDELLPKNTSLVMELSEILGISTDSAYRRMRTETFLSIDEIILLCDYYKISFDTFTNSDEGVVTFHYSKLESARENFKLYQTKIMNDLEKIYHSKEKHITYASEDIPIFHHYTHPVLAFFKMFYWMNSIMSVPELEYEKFDVQNIDRELEEIGNKTADFYSKVPSVEIWTETTIQSTVKQIEFFWDSGKFKTREDALKVVQSLREEISLVQKKAEKSTKLLDKNGEAIGDEQNFQLYFSEMELTNNCVLIDLGTIKSVYLGHFTFSTMSTYSDSYCNETKKWLNIVIKISSLISGVSEKQRYQVFRKYFKIIDELEKSISDD